MLLSAFSDFMLMLENLTIILTQTYIVFLPRAHIAASAQKSNTTTTRNQVRRGSKDTTMRDKAQLT